MGGSFPYISARCSLAKINLTTIFWSAVGTLLVIMFLLVLIIGLLLGLAGKSKAGNANLTVDLGYAKYEGVYEGGSINHWLGVRYAAAPTGNNRFRGPQPPETNITLQKADTVKSLVLQNSLHQLTWCTTERAAMSFQPINFFGPYSF